MIAAKDFETVRGVYRIRRLLVPQEQATETTFVLVQGLGITHEQVLALAAEEEEHRKTVLAKISELNRELAKL
jgi:hypothetical protein